MKADLAAYLQQAGLPGALTFTPPCFSAVGGQTWLLQQLSELPCAGLLYGHRMQPPINTSFEALKRDWSQRLGVRSKVWPLTAKRIYFRSSDLRERSRHRRQRLLALCTRECRNAMPARRGWTRIFATLTFSFAPPNVDKNMNKNTR